MGLNPAEALSSPAGVQETSELLVPPSGWRYSISSRSLTVAVYDGLILTNVDIIGMSILILLLLF